MTLTRRDNQYILDISKGLSPPYSYNPFEIPQDHIINEKTGTTFAYKFFAPSHLRSDTFQSSLLSAPPNVHSDTDESNESLQYLYSTLSRYSLQSYSTTYSLSQPTVATDKPPLFAFTTPIAAAYSFPPTTLYRDKSIHSWTHTKQLWKVQVKLSQLLPTAIAVNAYVSDLDAFWSALHAIFNEPPYAEKYIRPSQSTRLSKTDIENPLDLFPIITSQEGIALLDLQRNRASQFNQTPYTISPLPGTLFCHSVELIEPLHNPYHPDSNNPTLSPQ